MPKYEPKLRYSKQAKKVIEMLKDKIDMEEMEKHIEKDYFIVGGSHVWAYIIDKVEKNL